MKLKNVLILAALLFAATSFAQEPQNIAATRERLYQYHDSGQYAKDQAAVAHKALTYFNQQVKRNKKRTHPKKLAVILDIDETILSNYDDIKKAHIGGTNEYWDKITKMHHAIAIKSMKTLYDHIKAADVAVFFVTGRPDDSKTRRATVRNLHKEGIEDWEGLYMHPAKEHPKSIVTYKSAARKLIIDKGYDIIMNIGDQQSDLAGGLANKTFKLPNPYYLIR